jgi:hypothetical protein
LPDTFVEGLSVCLSAVIVRAERHALQADFFWQTPGNGRYDDYHADEQRAQ